MLHDVTGISLDPISPDNLKLGFRLLNPNAICRYYFDLPNILGKKDAK